MLHFGILGPLRVEDETHEIAVAGLRRRSLLLRLLISANQVVSSDRLVEDLWEGNPPPGATSTLQSHLSFLRRVLGKDLITHSVDGYVLRVGPGQIDVQLFEAEGRDGRRLLEACDFAGACDLLGSALRRWRGPALSDVSMSSWALPEATRLEELRAATIELHHDALLAQGLNGQVIEGAESAVVDHPLRENLWSQLMLALYRSGRQVDALHACQRLRSQLVELGLAPSRDVLELEDDILLHKPELDWTGPATEMRGRLRSSITNARSSDGAALVPHWLATPAAEFVGRDSELTLIDQLLKEAIFDVRPRIVLVTGEPGIGKSSLAAAAARSAIGEGRVVLYGHSDPYLDIPYQPWREALDQIFGGNASPGETEPVEVDPVLSAFGLGAPLGTELESPTNADVHVLYHAVLQALGTASEGRGLVLVLDDVHWSDPHSIQLLRRLISGPRFPILVIATYRDSEVPPGSPVSVLLADLVREESVTKLHLSGMNDTDVLSLLEARIQASDGDGVVTLRDTLMRETNGHPLFIVEILRHLSSQGMIDTDGHADWSDLTEAASTVPASLNQLIRERVASLGPETMQTLVAASVIGREFDLEVVAAVQSLQFSVVLDHLDSAVGASLVLDYGAGRFCFSHSLVARSLYDTLSPTRRAFVHGEVARVIERDSGDETERAAELAHHWLRASVPRDTGRALHYAQVAGDVALGRLAPEEARRWYTEALELLEETSFMDDQLKGTILAGLGDAERQCGDPIHRVRLLEAGRLALEIGDIDLAIRSVLANSRGFFAEAGHVDAERVELLRIVADRTSGRRDGQRARVLGQLAAELTFDADEESRRRVADEALALAREVGDPNTLVAVLNSCLSALQDADHLDEILSQSAEAVHLVDSLDNATLAGFAAGWRYVVAWQACDRTETDRMWARMEYSASSLGQPTLRWFIGFLAAHRAMVAGELDESERLAGEALNIGMETGQPDAFNVFGAQILRIGRERDAAASFLPLLEEAVLQNPDDHTARTMAARLYCDLGQVERARDIAAAYVERSYRPIKRDLFRKTSLCSIGHTIADLEWTDAAPELLEVLLPYSAQWDWIGPTSDGPVVGAVARLAALVGDLDLAETSFGLALELAQRFDSPLYRAQTLLYWGSALLAKGKADADRGVEKITESGEIARASGLPLMSRLARELLSR